MRATASIFMSNSAPPRDPRLLGLTGNIATGKSTVARQLAGYGALIIDGDAVARQVVEPGQPALPQIADAFGPDVLNADGSLNRAALGRIVFNDAAQLRRLEAITHPLIRTNILARIAAAPPEQVVVIDAIKLIERGYADRCAQVWVTDCPEALQIERLVRGRGLSEADARARIRAQAPQADKRARADVIIDTSTSLDDTHAQVAQAWAKFQDKLVR
jgi:dephospho-CoA kinase